MTANQWATEASANQLRKLILDRQSLLIVGATGTGKTSVLNALLQEVPSTERIVCIEDTSELHAPNLASCKLLTRREGMGSLRPYDLASLLRQSLRMRPSRIVLGEVRGGEAKDLLLALATGHNGSMGTLHADDSRQALLRLEMLVRLGASQWQTDAIRNLIHLSLDYIVVVEQKNGRRQLREISRIAGLERTGFLLESLDLK